MSRPATRSRAADLVADVLARTLGRNRRRRLLDDGSVDVARLGDLLHALRDRPRVAPRPDYRIHPASQRAVHATSRSDVYDRGRRTALRSSRATLRPRPEMEWGGATVARRRGDP